ncbi:hypothetical protein WICMUC_002312 [Wickerhamomyces mucosus]|uniref:BHLH domain-containing protein n=1 Tax=Wickerhamomyces mucosus TaxID=1378264 RepID=A0A9P8PPV6_9ASCO|nr:hypothetical protein WICMUC_002312 [Wickerhamomyces mucosus]
MTTYTSNMNIENIRKDDKINDKLHSKSNSVIGKPIKPKITRNRVSMLSEDDKKRHHIKSEHKRRAAIRDAFEKLVSIVPELSQDDVRSEITILSQSAKFLSELQKEHLNLLEQLKIQNVSVDENLIVEIPKFSTNKISRDDDP